MTRQRPFFVRRGLLLASIAVALGVSALAGTALVSPSLMPVVPVLMSFLPVAVGASVASLRGGWAVLAFAAVLGAQLGLAFGVSDTILTYRGERTSAVIVEQHRSTKRADGHYVYALTAGGRELNGTLRTSVEHDVGDRVEIVADPEGWAHSRKASELSSPGRIQTIVATTGALTLLGPALYLIATRAPRRS